MSYGSGKIVIKKIKSKIKNVFLSSLQFSEAQRVPPGGPLFENHRHRLINWMYHLCKWGMNQLSLDLISSVINGQSLDFSFNLNLFSNSDNRGLKPKDRRIKLLFVFKKYKSPSETSIVWSMICHFLWFCCDWLISASTRRCTFSSAAPPMSTWKEATSFLKGGASSPSRSGICLSPVTKIMFLFLSNALKQHLNESSFEEPCWFWSGVISKRAVGDKQMNGNDA